MKERLLLFFHNLINPKHDEFSIDKDPFEQFNKWLKQAARIPFITYPNAMTISTATKDGIPSSRIVLLKKTDKDGFIFFTNYESHKGKELSINPIASLSFYWPIIERQVRIVGTISKIDKQSSDDYYHSRSIGSQISAWASHQSKVVKNRKEMEDKYEFYKNKYESQIIPRPDYWGGYKLLPNYFEFWQGRINRFHDRIVYKQNSDKWVVARLAP